MLLFRKTLQTLPQTRMVVQHASLQPQHGLLIQNGGNLSVPIQPFCTYYFIPLLWLQKGQLS